MNDYISECFEPGGLFARRFPGYEARAGQVALARTIDDGLRRGRHVLGEAPCGCHVAGQPILMFDGQVKAVEDVELGERLMGPSGEPRLVLSLARGEQETVEIRPKKGLPWRVNMDHVLTLVRSDTGEIVDVTVREWLDWSKTHKGLHKLFRSPVEFAGRLEPLPLDAYSTGVLLGDNGLDAADAPRVAPRIRAAVGSELPPELATCDGEACVSDRYKTASLDDRRELLAGLIDAAGRLSGRARYELRSSSKRLADDATYVARSIGLSAYVQRCRTGSRIVYRVCISGETHLVPCRIARKRARQRRTRKSALQIGFDVARTGRVEPYFGFSLDADGRYLLGDFMVTHNTGKSMAYGVVASRYAVEQNKRVVIATANIALQEQLVGKDLPTLAELLPWQFKFAQLKGRSNYLCRDRSEHSSRRGFLRVLNRSEQEQIDYILDWAQHTSTGDVSELPLVPDPGVWSRLSVGADECKGDGCDYRDDCFAERSRAAAQGAHILVTNHHLLLAHLAVRRHTGADQVLPPFDAVILDEAHEAASIAREFFGFVVSEFTFVRLAAAAEDLGLPELARELPTLAARQFAALAEYARAHPDERRLTEPAVAPDAWLLEWTRMLERVATKRADESSLPKKERALARSIARRAATAAAHLQEALELGDTNKVYWIELNDKGRAKLCAKPIEVGQLLRTELFDRCPSVSLVSATLTTSGTFEFVRREVGVPDEAVEVVAETPFDFMSQALFIVPRGMPAYDHPEFVDAVAAAMERVVRACDGRTLGLFTSYRSLNAVYERLRGTTEHRLLRQGDMPRGELTRIFKEDVGSVLLGTNSFWTGIDVPGEALRAVVIDKLPFQRLDDPVTAAIRARDREWFRRYYLPQAIIAFRQGAGRLIRSKEDFGVIVLLDKRVETTNYGPQFLASLPEMETSDHLESIAGFLDEAGLVRGR